MQIGSGGAFTGFWQDDAGQWRSGADFIIYRLPFAQGLQFITIFWSMPKGLNPGFPCRAPGGEAAGPPTV